MLILLKSKVHAFSGKFQLLQNSNSAEIYLLEISGPWAQFCHLELIEQVLFLSYETALEIFEKAVMSLPKSVFQDKCAEFFTPESQDLCSGHSSNLLRDLGPGMTSPGDPGKVRLQSPCPQQLLPSPQTHSFHLCQNSTLFLESLPK